LGNCSDEHSGVIEDGGKFGIGQHAASSPSSAGLITKVTWPLSTVSTTWPGGPPQPNPDTSVLVSATIRISRCGGPPRTPHPRSPDRALPRLPCGGAPRPRAPAPPRP